MQCIGILMRDSWVWGWGYLLEYCICSVWEHWIQCSLVWRRSYLLLQSWFNKWHCLRTSLRVVRPMRGVRRCVLDNVAVWSMTQQWTATLRRCRVILWMASFRFFAKSPMWRSRICLWSLRIFGWFAKRLSCLINCTLGSLKQLLINWSFIEVINGVEELRIISCLKEILLRPQWSLKCLRQVLQQNWLCQGRLCPCVIGSFEEECDFYFAHSFLRIQ